MFVGCCRVGTGSVGTGEGKGIVHACAYMLPNPPTNLLCVCISLSITTTISPQGAAAAADEGEEVAVMVSAAPDDLRAEILVSRGASASAPANLLVGAGLNLPSRAIVSVVELCVLCVCGGVIWGHVGGSLVLHKEAPVQATSWWCRGSPVGLPVACEAHTVCARLCHRLLLPPN